MTMTHSDEVTNGSQKPGRTDVSAGVMTTQKESVKPVRLAHSWCAESCVEKTNQQAYAVTNSSEFKE